MIPLNVDGTLQLEQLDALLDDKTRLVAVTQVSNVLGTENPVAEIVEKAHQAGAKVLIDGAQAVMHHAVDVQALDCDFYVFSGHKLYGPTGIGVPPLACRKGPPTPARRGVLRRARPTPGALSGWGRRFPTFLRLALMPFRSMNSC